MFVLLSSSFKIALSSLKVNKARSALTVLGIVIGIASVITLVSVGNGLKELVGEQFASVGTNLLLIVPSRIAPGSFGSSFGSVGALTNQGKFVEEDLKAIRSLPEVESAVPDLDEFVRVSYQGKEVMTQVGGTNEDLLRIFSWSVSEGRFFTKGELESGRKVVLIGAKVKKELFDGSSLGRDLLVGQGRYRVIGALSARGGFGQMDWDNTVYMPLKTAERFFGRQRIDYIYFKVKDMTLVSGTIKNAEAILRRRHDENDFSILEQKDLFQAANSILSALTVALGGIASISLLVGGIGIMNIMLVSVTERTAEIGLRKALGARRSDILWQFLLEAVLLSGVGGIIGISLGLAGSLLLSRFLVTTVTAWSVLLSFSVSALVGIVFGILPAYKAAKLDPIEALRYE